MALHPIIDPETSVLQVRISILEAIRPERQGGSLTAAEGGERPAAIPDAVVPPPETADEEAATAVTTPPPAVLMVSKGSDASMVARSVGGARP